MKTSPEIKSLWLYPGELAILLERSGVRINSSSLLAAEEVFRHAELLRSETELFADVFQVLTKENLVTLLQMMANPSGLVKIKRAVHRSRVENGFAIIGVPGDSIMFLRTMSGGAAELLFSFTVNSLVDFVLGGMRSAQSIDLPLQTFLPLTPSGMAAMLALADRFNQYYPVPDPQWQPEAPLLFTFELLKELIEEGAQDEPSQSLIAAFQNLTDVSIPPVEPDELQSLLFLFANQEYIGVTDPDLAPGDADAVYFIGKNLTLALRCLAWWDFSLGIEPLVVPSDGSPMPVYALQATTMWQFVRQNDNPLRFAMRSMGGETWRQIVTKLLGRCFSSAPAAVEESLESRYSARRGVPAPNPPSSSPADRAKKAAGKPAKAARARQTKTSTAGAMTAAAVLEADSSTDKTTICPTCGKPNSQSARFCRYCGAAAIPREIAPLVDIKCPQCGKRVRSGATFCKYCGSPVKRT